MVKITTAKVILWDNSFVYNFVIGICIHVYSLFVSMFIQSLSIERWLSIIHEYHKVWDFKWNVVFCCVKYKFLFYECVCDFQKCTRLEQYLELQLRTLWHCLIFEDVHSLKPFWDSKIKIKLSWLSIILDRRQGSQNGTAPYWIIMPKNHRTKAVN